jgi:hypothetical protein
MARIDEVIEYRSRLDRNKEMKGCCNTGKPKYGLYIYILVRR